MLNTEGTPAKLPPAMRSLAPFIAERWEQAVREATEDTERVRAPAILFGLPNPNTARHGALANPAGLLACLGTPDPQIHPCASHFIPKGTGLCIVSSAASGMVPNWAGIAMTGGAPVRGTVILMLQEDAQQLLDGGLRTKLPHKPHKAAQAAEPSEARPSKAEQPNALEALSGRRKA